MTTTSDEAGQELPTYPIPRGGPFDPHPDYAKLRAQCPVTRCALPNGRTGWLVTSYDLVRQVLGDARVSSNWLHPNFPLPMEMPPEAVASSVALSSALMSADPPEHTDRKRMLISEFATRQVRAMTTRVQEIVDIQIDALLAGPKPADLVAGLALPVPTLVICELLGVPYDDRGYFRERTKLLAGRQVAPSDVAKAGAELFGYMDALVTKKEQNPGDDLLGRLIRRNEGTGVFDHQLLVAMATLLLVAGHETTANMISLGTLALLENPEQLAALRTDPELIGPAVDELLRYLTIIEADMRIATADLEVGGITVKAGEGLVAMALAADRDEKAFPDPDTLRLGRPERHHVAFGYGIHQCLGQNLARLELEVVFATLFRRIPGLRLATAVDELPFKDDANIHGLHELPVIW